MKDRLVAIATAAVLASVLHPFSQPAIADAGPIQMPGTNHWYQWFENPVYFWEAIQRSNSLSFQGMKGHLVTITSQAENEFLRHQDGRNFWIALQDIGPRDGGRRQWAWTDGPEIGTAVTNCAQWQSSDSCSSVAGGYSNWSANEPNNAYGRESAAINNWFGGGWNDAGPTDNGNGFGYIVEFEPDWQPTRVSGQPAFFNQTGSSARGIEVLATGEIFVARGGTGSPSQPGAVWQLDSEGTPQKAFTGSGSVHSIAQMSDGTLLAAQWADNSLARFNVDGSTTYIPIGDISYDVDILPDENLLVTGGNAAWVRVYTPEGVLVRSISEKACALYSAVDQTGAVIFMSSMTWSANCLPFGVYKWTAATGLTRLPTNLPPGQYEGIAVDMAERVYLSDNSKHQIVVVEPSGDSYTLTQFSSGGVYALALTRTGNLLVTTPAGMYQVAVRGSTSPALPPGRVGVSTLTSGQGSLTASWIAPEFDGNLPVLRYVAVASPGGRTCIAVAPATSCTFTGLSRNQSYSVSVTAVNARGGGMRSAASSTAFPMLPGFQTWLDDVVLAPGNSTTLQIAQGLPRVSVAVSGAVKATVALDAHGSAAAPFTATKVGIQKFTASYSVKVGKKTTKYTATAQLYVPSVSGPMLKIKAGKTGKFSMQFMPADAAVSIQLSDGRTLTGTADSLGKATFTPTFTTLGAVMYTVSVAGVQVGTGGLTIVK